MSKTRIEWADEVWNPISGCTKVSEGCRHCYAERVARRFWGERKFGDVRMHPEKLDEPLHWRKPRRVFVNSMSDLFHPSINGDFIANVFRVMEKTPAHRYMILTKRPKEMWNWFGKYNAEKPLPNVWLGVSVETQKTADERIPWLLRTPAAVRFVSAEPLIGPVDLRSYFNSFQPMPWPTIAYPKIHWLICGGESGPGARPMHPDWARSLRNQCVDAGVSFFFKQWGEWWPAHPQYGDTDSVERFEDEHPNSVYDSVSEVCLENDGSAAVSWFGDNALPGGYQPRPGLNPWWMHLTGKGPAGRLLDGREWNEEPSR